MAAAATDERVGNDTGDGEEGESIEEQAAKEQPLQLAIPGTEMSLSLDAGGDDPETSSVKLHGGSAPIEGQYAKGAIIKLWVEVRVSEVHFVDSIDKFGHVTGTERRHIGKMMRVQRIPEGNG